MKGKACLVLYFFCLTISACATDDHASRKIVPSWVPHPPAPTEEKLYFVGKSTAKSLEEGKKAAAANAITELFAFAFGVTGKAEYESQAVRDKIAGMNSKRVAESIKISTASGSSISLYLADWHWQKNENGDFEVWVLVEVEKKAIAKAQKEKTAKKKQIQELLKKARELAQKNEIKSAIEILENIDCQTVEEDIKFDCLNTIKKVTANIKIETEKENSEAVIFKVLSKKGEPLSGIPVTCQSQEKISKDWSDAFGRVQCPKALLTTKIFAQVLAPFGPKIALKGAFKFKLVRMKNDSLEYKLAFENFSEILLKNGVAASIIDVPNAQGSELESEIISALRDRSPWLIIVFELVSCERTQTYDANDPANYYYVTKFNYFVKIGVQARLVSYSGFGETVEIFSKFVSHERTSEVTLNDTAAPDLAVAKTAQLAGEQLAKEFIVALAEFERSER